MNKESYVNLLFSYYKKFVVVAEGPVPIARSRIWDPAKNRILQKTDCWMRKRPNASFFFLRKKSAISVALFAALHK